MRAGASPDLQSVMYRSIEDWTRRRITTLPGRNRIPSDLPDPVTNSKLFRRRILREKIECNVSLALPKLSTFYGYSQISTSDVIKSLCTCKCKFSSFRSALRWRHVFVSVLISTIRLVSWLLVGLQTQRDTFTRYLITLNNILGLTTLNVVTFSGPFHHFDRHFE